LRESKRLSSVLRAFGRMPANVRLMIAGEIISSDLRRALLPQLGAVRILRLPYLPGRRLWMALMAADACINLRFPAAGETSDITVQAMGSGRAVILSDSLENSGIPETACARVEHGAGECEHLFGQMTLLSGLPEAARQMGRNAEAWVRERHAIERVAAQYWEILCAHRG
jgi:hypothetical protein